MKRAFAALGRFVLAPFRELLAGLDLVLTRGAPALGWVGAGLLAGWWVYVPLHELAHAFGCLAAGGSVSRLEIDPIYGAGLLRHIFPFVEPGGEYAGRLSGFDTGGSDLVYLATDLAPYLLTLFPGVWWLRRAALSGRPFLFGAALPCALAPFISITGDAYEIGSLLVANLPPGAGRRELIGDDLFLKAGELDLGSDPALAVGFALAILLALVWAFAWYGLGGALARRAGAPPLVLRSR